MTSIDLYRKLIQNVDPNCLDSQRLSRISTINNKKDQFQIAVFELNKYVLNIKENNSDILRLKDKFVSCTSPQKQSNLCNQIKNLCDDNFKIITIIKQQMTKIGQIVTNIKKQQPDQPQTFSKIYRKQHLAQNIQKIINQTFSIQKIVQKFSIQTNLKRIRIILPDASDKQLKQLANDANGFKQAIAQKVTSKASNKWVYAAKDYLSKSQGIVALQKSVDENLRLMKQVAMLVQQQGQMIDDILKNVSEAKDYVFKAEAILKKQKQQNKKSKKKLCWIILVCLVIIGLIVTPIVLKIVNNNNSSANTNSNQTITNTTNIVNI